MNLHDQHYRKLFSSPHMVRALFEGILPPALRDGVDLDTLEPLPTAFVSELSRDRQADRVWRVRRRDGHMLYLLILLEHQSQADRIMSIRFMGYTALLYEDLLMRQSLAPSQRLPAILPLVIYSGDARWKAPLQVSDLLDEAPADLLAYQPQMRYLMLDEGALVARGKLPDRNLAALMFRLEHNQGLEQAAQILQTILRLTRAPEFFELRRAFGLWVRYVLLPQSLPPTIRLPTEPDLQELTTMLSTHSKDWSQRWRHEGRQEGRQEGAAAILERLLTRRFGPLAPEIIARLHGADTEQLQAWSMNVLDAETLEQVFTQSS